ncbi:MAG: transposase [Planctomycetes bacterium]|nr:transposase [Planctomycetota bacterium]
MEFSQHRPYTPGGDTRRNVIERCIGWFKECRRVGAQFEKLALNFLCMVKLAIFDRLEICRSNQPESSLCLLKFGHTVRAYFCPSTRPSTLQRPFRRRSSRQAP